MSWEKVKLEQFLKNRKGRYKPNDKAILGLKRIDKIDFAGNIYLSEKPSNTDMILVKKGDLVISGINVEKGAMNIYLGEDDAVATIHYSSYEFDENNIDIEFLKWFLKSVEFKNALKEQVPGGIKTEIKPKHILPLEVFIPTDIEEQKNIVKNLNRNNNSVNDISLELTNQLNLIKQLRQSFLREAMQGKLVSNDTKDGKTGAELLAEIQTEKENLIKEKKIKKSKPLPPISEEEIPFEIPENLKLIRLGEIANIEKGKIGIQKAIKGIYPLVVTSEERLSSNEYHFEGASVIVPLVSSTGHGHASMKRIHYQDGKYAVGNILGVIQTYLPNFFNTRFLFNYLDYYKEQFFVEKMKGAANVSLKLSSIQETPIPVIPISAQNKYEELMQYCDQLETSVKESQKLNEQLLQQVLREALQPKAKEVVLPLVAEDREEKYDLWLSNQGLAARGTMDEKTLREIFDAMDDEDK